MAFSFEIKSLVSSAFMSTKSRVKQIMILLRFEIKKKTENINTYHFVFDIICLFSANRLNGTHIFFDGTDKVLQICHFSDEHASLAINSG